MKKLTILLLLFVTITGIKQADAQKAKTRLNHIALYVIDLQKSTDFYQNFIGLDTIPEPFHDGRHTWFGLSDHSHLHLIQGAKEKVNQDKNSHLCFSVPSIEVFIDKLKKAGIPYENWAGTPNEVTNRVDGVKQIYFKDMNGYWLEVNDDHS